METQEQVPKIVISSLLHHSLISEELADLLRTKAELSAEQQAEVNEAMRNLNEIDS